MKEARRSVKLEMTYMANLLVLKQLKDLSHRLNPLEKRMAGQAGTVALAYIRKDNKSRVL